MPLFTAPTMASVMDEAGLRPEQINARYVTADEINAISSHIEVAVRRVEQALVKVAMPYKWPFSDEILANAFTGYTQSERAELSVGQQGLATDIARDLALSFLYRRSGQLQKAYADAADRYEGKAMVALGTEPQGDDKGSGLLGQLAMIVAEQGVQPADNSFSVAAVRNDGYSQVCDEYSRYCC